jgi:trimethylamine--corrinoid protein Co-methyltransferase
MRIIFQVLSDDSQAKVHERTLKVLSETGVRVNTAKGRQFLKNAGADVNENSFVVRFPADLVEESIKVATKKFSLGARRPGWDLEMNAGNCTLLVDGGAVFTLDRETRERRPSTFEDWLQGTKLIDSLDELGLYWTMVQPGEFVRTPLNLVNHWRDIFRNFSKHVQYGILDEAHASWYLETLHVIFGDKETIRREHPISFLLCPQSPLVLEGPATDAYLALQGYDIPVAVMPMPLMGSTAPGSMISTLILGNAEILAMLCLIQAAAPGTPFIYAPALAVMDPRTAKLGGGTVEGALMNAAAIEMARYYGFPVIGGGGGSGHHVPSQQLGYEGALGTMPPVLLWPDILCGPGLMGGSMILSLEELLIDVEVYKISQRVYKGISTDEDKWLDDVIATVGPGGHYIAEPSTVTGTRGGEWYIPDLGWHESFEVWEERGKPSILDEARERVDKLLREHQPLPLGADVERELDKIAFQAGQYSG